LVYDVLTFQFLKLLAYHRESVRCLLCISDSAFASGSLDGAVVIWSCDSLSPLRILMYPDTYIDSNKRFTHSIGKLIVMNNSYIAAAVGQGYCVFDIETGEIILECPKGHEGEVTDIISLYGGTRLITSSADSCIRVWGAKHQNPIPPVVRTSGLEQILEAKPSLSLFEGREKPLRVVCLGEMWAHSDTVSSIESLSETSFASCSSDFSVILWKDGRVQKELRDCYANVLISGQYYQREIESGDRSDRSDCDATSEKSGNLSDGRANSIGAVKRKEDIRKVKSDNEKLVPDHLLQYANFLAKEKKMTIEQVAQNLRYQGHAIHTIEAIKKSMSSANE